VSGCISIETQKSFTQKNNHNKPQVVEGGEEIRGVKNAAHYQGGKDEHRKYGLRDVKYNELY
jgi:hypothetical protein